MSSSDTVAHLEAVLAEVLAQAAKDRAKIAEVQAQAAKDRAELAEAQAQLAHLSLALPPPPLPDAGVAISLHPRVRTLQEAEKTRKVIKLSSSPSKEKDYELLPNFCHFRINATPHVAPLKMIAQGDRLSSLATTALDLTIDTSTLLREEHMYPLSTAFVPDWVNATPRLASLRDGAKSAKSLHGTRTPSIPGFELSWACFPELLVAARPFHPGFNGEVKSAISSSEGPKPRMYEELVTYVMLDIVSSLFCDVPDAHRRFFSIPPVGYGLVACSHVAYIVAIEWIGKLFVSVVSEPFFLGSDKHRGAIAALPDFNFEEACVDLNIGESKVASWSPAGADGPRIFWRAEGSDGDDFFKIVMCKDTPTQFFENMFSVYAALAEAWRDERDPPPPSLLPSRLLYGPGEVCATMPWISGRDAELGDVGHGGCAVEPVADAVAWLARHGMIYTDLRLPNVRIAAAPSTRVFLIDYDDIAICDRVCSREDLEQRCKLHDAYWTDPHNTWHLPAIWEAVQKRWE